MTFQAILFDPRSKDSSRVSVRPFGSTLEVTGGAETLRVDPSKCALQPGGWDRSALQVTWPGEGGIWAISSTDPEAAGDLAKIPQFEAALRTAVTARAGARRSGRLGMALLALLTLLPLLAIVGLYIFRDRVIDVVLDRIPLSVDREVGKMFEGSVANAKDVVTDTEATRAINLIVHQLEVAGRARADMNSTEAGPGPQFIFRVRVERNQDVNAFAAPGGLIVVYTGLIAKAGSAEEVAGVLAHEMAHVTRRHSMRQLLYRAGLLPLMGMLLGHPDAASLFESFGQLSDLKFSRGQEEDADFTGFNTLVAAGISTEGMAAFFERLADMGGTPPSFLSTHPSSTDRAARIRERTKGLDAVKTGRLPIDWIAVKASVP